MGSYLRRCFFFLATKAQHYSEIFPHSKSSIVGKIVDSLSNILSIKLFARQSFESRFLRASLEDTVVKDQQLGWYLLKVNDHMGQYDSGNYD